MTAIFMIVIVVHFKKIFYNAFRVTRPTNPNEYSRKHNTTVINKTQISMLLQSLELVKH